MIDEGKKEACGVVGVYAPDRAVAHMLYLGLYALQHRGQESAGIAVSDGDDLTVVKDMGLVSNVFDDRTLSILQGDLGIGQTRYSTTGSSTWRNAQPVYRGIEGFQFALGHNGNLVNTAELASDAGMLPGTVASDSDLVAELMALHASELQPTMTQPIADADEAAGPMPSLLESVLLRVLPMLQGAFTFVVSDEHRVIGVRDPNGFRPMSLGKLDGGWVIASETPALDVIGAHFVRELDPGEMVIIDGDGVRSIRPFDEAVTDPHLCLFEFVYFARPDSRLYGQNVHGARVRMGKNRYIGRTFIAPTQELRTLGVRMKLNPLRENIAGKRLVVVDDSIVRGTTTRGMVSMLRESGATEIHMRISSPPYRWPCFYGMDTGRRSELLAANLDVEEIREYLNVDTLAYLSLDRLVTATGAVGAGFCDACLTGEYPVAVPVELSKTVLEDAEQPPSLAPGLPGFESIMGPAT